MRSFIQFCGGLFVIGGMIGAVIALFAAVGSLSAGGFAAAAGLTVLIGSASVTLIGGTAYMLCQIDQRLERIAGTDSETPQPMGPEIEREPVQYISIG